MDRVILHVDLFDAWKNWCGWPRYDWPWYDWALVGGEDGYLSVMLVSTWGVWELIVLRFVEFQLVLVN